MATRALVVHNVSWSLVDTTVLHLRTAEGKVVVKVAGPDDHHIEREIVGHSELTAQEQVIIVHISPDGPTEVARHCRATPGSPKINDGHFPPTPAGAVDRKPLARNPADVEFLAIGDGARLWLTEAAAAGTTKIRVKMAQAVTLAKLFETKDVDWALGHAAVHARFAEADLASILDHHHTATNAAGSVSRAGEHGSLTQGAAAWAALGAPAAAVVATTAGIDDGEQEVTQ